MIAVYPALHPVKAVLLTDVVMMYTRCAEADTGVEVKVQQSEIFALDKMSCACQQQRENRFTSLRCAGGAACVALFIMILDEATCRVCNRQ